jgi:hypothetical protein
VQGLHARRGTDHASGAACQVSQLNEVTQDAWHSHDIGRPQLLQGTSIDAREAPADAAAVLHRVISDVAVLEWTADKVEALVQQLLVRNAVLTTEQWRWGCELAQLEQAHKDSLELHAALLSAQHAVELQRGLGPLDHSEVAEHADHATKSQQAS